MYQVLFYSITIISEKAQDRFTTKRHFLKAVTASQVSGWRRHQQRGHQRHQRTAIALKIKTFHFNSDDYDHAARAIHHTGKMVQTHNRTHRPPSSQSLTISRRWQRRRRLKEPLTRLRYQISYSLGHKQPAGTVGWLCENKDRIWVEKGVFQLICNTI